MTDRVGIISPSTKLETMLARELSWISKELEARIAEVTPASSLRGSDHPRAAYRVVLEDERRVKLRRMKTAERAAELSRLLVSVKSLGLPQPILVREECIVTEWLAGTPLEPAQAEPEVVRAAGVLLARIHQIPASDLGKHPVECSSEALLEETTERLQALVRGARISSRDAARIDARVRALAPQRMRMGLTHGDFSGENLLVDAAGELRVVDNEGLQPGVLDVDLARVHCRWPMSEHAWSGFLSAYCRESGREVEDDDLAAWKIQSEVLSAWYRHTHGLEGAERALDRLLAL